MQVVTDFLQCSCNVSFTGCFLLRSLIRASMCATSMFTHALLHDFKPAGTRLKTMSSIELPTSDSCLYFRGIHLSTDLYLATIWTKIHTINKYVLFIVITAHPYILVIIVLPGQQWTETALFKVMYILLHVPWTQTGHM